MVNTKEVETINISSSCSEDESTSLNDLKQIIPENFNLSIERKNELKAAQKFYESQIARETATLQNLKATTKNIEIAKLPDKGVKLRSSIEKQVQKVKELNEQLTHVLLNIDAHETNGPSKGKPQPKTHLPSITELTKDHMNLNELGKQALKTHQIQQAATVETLERLHNFMSHSNECTTEAPDGLKVSLLPHQLVSLAWLEKREREKPAGGILADDMGLGKTLTLISLILKRKHQRSTEESGSSSDDDVMKSHKRKFLTKGSTLVVCPASVMDQWSEEIKSKVKSGYLSVYTHHGAKREKNPRRLAVYDVVLTTYTILQYDNKGEDLGPLLSLKWDRVILDEAHTIRNHKSQTAQAAFLLKSRSRWALTGTPIQNKQDDFYSLLKFLKCKPFDDLLVWKKMIDNKGNSGMMRLHLLTKSLLLRRTKDEIQKEGGLKELKPKEFKIVEVIMDPEEQKVYNKIFSFSGTLLAQYIHQQAEKQNLLVDGLNIRRAGPSNPFKDHPELSSLYNQMVAFKGGIKSHHILVLLLRLRQTCCHPSLITEFINQQEMNQEGVEDEAGVDLDLVDQMMNLTIHNNDQTDNNESKSISSDDPVFDKKRCSSKMRATIDCLVNIIKESEGKDKSIVVSQWTSVLNILENLLKKKEIKTIALNGSIPVKERGDILKDFNNNSHGPKVMLLSLTAGGTGLNLIGANHLILFDIHWNPQLEAQACDRVYRVGQTKTVHIYKFLCKDTIEERILKLQNTKLELAKGVLSGTSTFQNSKLKLNDLKELFNIA